MTKIYVIVEEVLAQSNYIFKQLLLVHQEYHSLLEDGEKLADEECFEEVDEFVFTFRHRVYSWLREAETEWSTKKVYSKKRSKSTSSGSSRKAKSGNSGGRSRCSKERAMEEKVKLAELMTEQNFPTETDGRESIWTAHWNLDKRALLWKLSSFEVPSLWQFVFTVGLCYC